MRALVMLGLGLLALWVIAAVVVKVTGFVIKLLLFAGIIFLVVALVRGGMDKMRKPRGRY